MERLESPPSLLSLSLPPFLPFFAQGPSLAFCRRREGSTHFGELLLGESIPGRRRRRAIDCQRRQGSFFLPCRGSLLAGRGGIIGVVRNRWGIQQWRRDPAPPLGPRQSGWEEEIPELEIDVDELLDMESDESRSARVKELLVDCYKPTEVFVADLLDKIRGMQKLSTPQKK
ncbi:protein phosphatase 1 regulatory subunit 14B isoform X1 [Sceloporus undulatus]|uniref:protein phosphatase 1 regulatory subunit 14B isoform X1 n=1 Tax=Sceloporus undulatus TaxID=8520 RepID=UPI001C4BE060|nr:protein phosphatase 1 regulatory subunit 14B isoform X1 [Sceloporus undulatus]